MVYRPDDETLRNPFAIDTILPLSIKGMWESGRRREAATRAAEIAVAETLKGRARYAARVLREAQEAERRAAAARAAEEAAERREMEAAAAVQSLRDACILHGGEIPPGIFDPTRCHGLRGATHHQCLHLPEKRRKALCGACRQRKQLFEDKKKEAKSKRWWRDSHAHNTHTHTHTHTHTGVRNVSERRIVGLRCWRRAGTVR